MTRSVCKDCPKPTVMWKDEEAWMEKSVHPQEFCTPTGTMFDDAAFNDSNVILIMAQAAATRDCKSCRKSFEAAFRMPALWWSRHVRRSNGYFGCELTKKESEVTGLNTWSRFLIKQVRAAPQYQGTAPYKWYKLNIFTRWLLGSSRTIVLLFDVPSQPVVGRLQEWYRGCRPEQFGDPLYIYTWITDQVVSLQDDAVWNIRDQARAMETARMPEGKPQPTYRSFHDLVRHAIHVSETLDVALATMESLVGHYERVSSELAIRSDLVRETSSRLLFSRDLVRALRARSGSNHDRLRNETQLTFHIAAQYDTGVSVEIGRATQSDSASMKTIATFSLVFLPATFVSALFSTSFFSFDAGSDSWTISSKFWVYWAVALPATVFTSLVWYSWGKAFPASLMKGRQESLRAWKAWDSLG